MKIALFGASGMIGQRILQEALSRGHQVTAVVRDPARFNQSGKGLSTVAGDVLDSSSIAQAVKGNDVVISAIGPGPAGALEAVVDSARALLEGLARAGVKRLIAVGGAGSLEVAPGVQLLDAPVFPAAYKGIALAHRDALELYRSVRTDVDWVNICPPAIIEPGERAGKYRVGGDQLLTDDKGESRISAEDYAVALLDEVESNKHHRQRITVGY